jgi:hypothetical protein
VRDALHPSPRLQRRIAAQVVDSADPQVRRWALAVLAAPVWRNAHPGVSVIEVWRDCRLCGYEVWRHLETYTVDPRRHKARLFFGRGRCGGLRRARLLAEQAAAQLAAMSRSELHEWWSEYRVARSTRRPVTNLWRSEPRYADALDYTDRALMSHAVGRR